MEIDQLKCDWGLAHQSRGMTEASQRQSVVTNAVQTPCRQPLWPAARQRLGVACLLRNSRRPGLAYVFILRVPWCDPHPLPLVQRGHKLFAHCVSWCRSEQLHLALASSVFMTYVLPSVAWGADLLAHSPPDLRILDHALRKWRRHFFDWPTGSPNLGLTLKGYPQGDSSPCTTASLQWVAQQDVHCHPQCSRSLPQCQGLGPMMPKLCSSIGALLLVDVGLSRGSPPHMIKVGSIRCGALSTKLYGCAWSQQLQSLL